MGDRANIKVTGHGDVHLYTHWAGTELPKTLQDGLIRGRSRWDDPIYLARILFCEMVKDDADDITGYGISGKVGDGDNRVLTVDTENQIVKWSGRQATFEEYIGLDSPGW